tara:strand:- start:957 stop:1256 length:300 start_codon:yes stop_codon:yes gene_type:complete
MITLNGNKFAANDTEFTNSLFDTDGTCVGFYKAYKNVINLLDMHKVKVGVITKHKVLALATKLDNGKWWYSHGDILLVGAYDKYSERYNDVKQALTKLN